MSLARITHRGFEDAFAGRNDLLADAVSGDDRDSIFLHAFLRRVDLKGVNKPLKSRVSVNLVCTMT